MARTDSRKNGMWQSQPGCAGGQKIEKIWSKANRETSQNSVTQHTFGGMMSTPISYTVGHKKGRGMPRLIRLPYPHRYASIPCFDGTKLLAHIVTGLMFFPGQQDEQKLRAYISLGSDAVFSAALKDGMPPQEAFVSLLEIVSLLFEGKEQGVPARLRHATAWGQYQRTLREARFPSQGKGSIMERFIRGQLAGLLVNAVLLNGQSLTKAAEEVEAQWPMVKSSLPEWIQDSVPTMTAANLMQNVWPMFRTVGHLWAALHDFDLEGQLQEKSSILLDLSTIQELGTLILPAPDGKDRERIPLAAWPSHSSGLMALLLKANHILAESNKRGPLKQSAKPLLPVGECWQVVISG